MLVLVPAGNELVQVVQRGVVVNVELPLEGCLRVGDSMLPRRLMDKGVVVTVKSDPSWKYKGVWLIVDQPKFLYSASPLFLCPPGASMSFVAGPTAQ